MQCVGSLVRATACVALSAAQYDTKADHAEPPRTHLTLLQKHTGETGTLTIGKGPITREWRVRIHMPAGAGEAVTTMQLELNDGTKEDLPMVYPVVLTGDGIPPRVGGVNTIIVEAVVPSLPDREQTVHFQLAASS